MKNAYTIKWAPEHIDEYGFFPLLLRNSLKITFCHTRADGTQPPSHRLSEEAAFSPLGLSFDLDGTHEVSSPGEMLSRPEAHQLHPCAGSRGGGLPDMQVSALQKLGLG